MGTRNLDGLSDDKHIPGNAGVPVALVAQVTGVCAGQRRTLEHTSMIILYDNPDILTHKTLQETASSVLLSTSIMPSFGFQHG